VVRHNLVQRIVRAYEKYNEMMGAGRQLTLRLADNAPEVTPDAAAAPPAGSTASLESIPSQPASLAAPPANQPAGTPGVPNA
jgi:phosphate starvation-inducible PhoH-like protein